MLHKIIPPTDDDIEFFAKRGSDYERGIKDRIIVERAIIRRLCTDLIVAGHSLRLWDGEEWSTERTDVAAEILAATHATDEEIVYVYKLLPRADGQGDMWKKIGYVFLVYGNDGPDVIADYTNNLEGALAGVNEFATTLEA